MPKKIVAIGGDGVGPEVINAACSILESVSLELEIIKSFARASNENLDAVFI